MRQLRLALLALFLLCSFVSAQTSAPPGKPVQSDASREVDPEIAQRRSIALSTLQSLAIEARSYRDEPLRARVQARIADVLWDQDKESARTLFSRAWEIAEALDTKPLESGGGFPGSFCQPWLSPAHQSATRDFAVGGPP